MNSLSSLILSSTSGAATQPTTLPHTDSQSASSNSGMPNCRSSIVHFSGLQASSSETCAVSTPLSPSAADTSLSLSLSCVNIDMVSSAGLRSSPSRSIDLLQCTGATSLHIELFISILSLTNTMSTIDSLLELFLVSFESISSRAGVGFVKESSLECFKSSKLAEAECMGTRSSSAGAVLGGSLASR